MGSIKSETTPTIVKNNAKPYGKIVLSLQNQLLPEEKLQTTPSQIDGLDRDTETDLRIYGCELIQTAGILLKLPQVAMATGQVLLQRFYYSKSLVRHPVEQTAMASICLASKIEEAPRRVRDVINVFNHIRQVTSNKNITPVILDQNYIQLKNQVIKAERRVLKELGFSVHIKHPHKIIVMYLQVLNYEKNQQLMQYSWNYMNDSLRTDVFVRYQPETVACACIYLTARKLKLPLPKNPHWFTLFGITENEIRQVCLMILRLYNRPKINVDNLEKKIEELCKKYQDAKVKARGNSGDNTPNNNSPSSPGAQKSSGAHNAWGGFIRTREMQFKISNFLGAHIKVETEEKINRSGSHIVPSNEKRSRSKSPSHSPTNKHHKRMKKHGRSRSRSPSRNHKKSHKRKPSYSRSRSNSPHKVARKGREKRRSRSISDDKEVRNDRYIDRYERHEKIEKYTSRDEKYVKEERERYVEKERYDDKFDRKERHEKNDKRYERGERDDKYREERYKDDRYKEDRHNNRDEKERYRKSKHRDEEKEREREKKDRRR